MIKIGYYIKMNLLTYVIMSSISTYSILSLLYDWARVAPVRGLVVVIFEILLIFFIAIASHVVVSYCKMTILRIHKLIPYMLKRFDGKKFADDHLIEYYISKMDSAGARKLVYDIANHPDIEYIKDKSFDSDYVHTPMYDMYRNWSDLRFNIEAFKILRHIKKKKLEIDFKEL